MLSIIIILSILSPNHKYISILSTKVIQNPPIKTLHDSIEKFRFDLSEKIEQDGQNLNDMRQSCLSQTKSAKKSVSKNSKEIEKSNNDFESLKLFENELSKSIQDSQFCADESSDAILNFQKEMNLSSTHFAVEEGNLSMTISAIEKALLKLSRVSDDSSGRNSKDGVDALEEGGVSLIDSTVSSSSSEVVSILTNILKNAQLDLSKLSENFQEKSKSYKMEIQRHKGLSAECFENLEISTKKLASVKLEISQFQKNLNFLKAESLKFNQIVNDLKIKCENDDAEFSQEISENEELLEKVVEVQKRLKNLSFAVPPERGEFLEVFGRFEQTVFHRKKVKSSSSMGSSSSISSSSSTLANDNLKTYLLQGSNDDESDDNATIDGPFTKVKLVIKKLISHLSKLNESDANHSAFCKSEKRQTSKSLKAKSAELTSLESRKAEIREHKLNLKREADESVERIKFLQGVQADEIENFTNEESRLSEEVNHYTESLNVLLKVVDEFQKLEHKSNSFVQLAPVNSHDINHKMIKSHVNFLKKKTSETTTPSANPMLDLIEIIQSKFETILNQATSKLQQIRENHPQSIEKIKREIATLEVTITHCSDNKKSASKEIQELKGDLKEVRAQVKELKEYSVKLQGICAPKGDTAQEVIDRKNRQIEGLKSALEALQA